MDIPTDPSPATFHAPPERLPVDRILEQSSALGDLTGLATLLDSMPDFVMLLNEQRQIVFGNRALRDFAEQGTRRPLLGLRPGELFDCRQAAVAPAGCGTGQACRTCGAVNAILGALAGHSVTHECRISSRAAEDYDLRIWASPFRWPAGHFVLVIAVDISNEKRRQVLERIGFLHADYSIDEGKTWNPACYAVNSGPDLSRQVSFAINAKGGKAIIRVRVAFRGGAAGDVDCKGGAIKWDDSWQKWRSPTTKYAIIYSPKS